MKNIYKRYRLLTFMLLLGVGNAFADPPWPENWHILPKGVGEKVFSLNEDAASGLRVLQMATNSDVGNLMIDFDMPLTEQTTLKWRWNVQRLPSEVAENTVQTHDYLAIAIMFDDDQVMSYIWSANLPVGTVFQCPLPRWKDRETHLVMYSGAGQLGQWLDEERHLAADYSRLKKRALPKAIKQVWFIAGSKQGHSGAASFSDISLGDKADDRRKILSQRGLSQLDKNLAAINSTLPGQWTGFMETESTEGKLVRNDLTMSYTTISNDKLDYAYWGPRGFTLARYQGDGKYQLQQWPFAGEPSIIEYRVTAVTPPDATGNWRADEIVSAPDAKGDLQQWHQQWSLKDGELRVAKDKEPGASPTPGMRGYQITKVK